MTFTNGLFKFDHIARGRDGRPIGRIVMADDSSYIPGEDFFVSMFKVPKVFDLSYKGLELFIDGYRYKIPEDLSTSRVKDRVTDVILTNFVLQYIGESSDG